MKQKWNPLTGRWNISGKDTSTGPLQILIVKALPQTGEEGIIYIVEGALYSTMYVRDVQNNKFVKVGTTQVTTQQQADRAEEDDTSVSYIRNKPMLALVAITGNYEDLEDLPEIPTVYNTTITFKKNGEPVATITTNQDEDSEVDFNIPTKTSDLENDVPFLTEADVGPAALSNDYNDLDNLPNIPENTSDLNNDSGFITNTVNNLVNYTKTEDLAPVALSNDYEDLDNLPSIPVALSDLENDTGFITNTVNNLTNYYTRNTTYTKQEVDNLLAGISSLRVEVVSTLPNPGEFGVIYLIESSTPGIYNQFILTALPNTYVQVGSTEIDLTNYFNKVTDTADSITEGVNNLFMTPAERDNLSNQSGVNTGDETTESLRRKLGRASATTDGLLRKEDWRNFDDKADYDDFIRVPVTGNTININNPSTQTTGTGTITINTGSSVRSGLVYLLKIKATGAVTLRLGTGVTNPADVILTVPAGYTKVFVMLATSATTLEMQGIDVSDFVKYEDIVNFVTRGELARVAFTGNYNDLSGKPSIPKQIIPEDGKLIIKQDGIELGKFSANQSTNTEIQINTAPVAGGNLFSTIGEIRGTDSFEGLFEAQHGLGKRPNFIDIEAYVDIGDDSQGRQTATRLLVSWKRGETDRLGTIFHFSNGQIAGGPTDFPTLPISITATSTYVRVVSHYHVKMRITAYL